MALFGGASFANLTLQKHLGPTQPTPPSQPRHDPPPRLPAEPASSVFYRHSAGQRVNTDAVLSHAIRAAHPSLSMTVIPLQGITVQGTPLQGGDLLSYAEGTGLASFTPIIDPADPETIPLIWRSYIPPAARLDGGEGGIVNMLKFGKFHYVHGPHEYILYVSECRDGDGSYPILTNQYLLHGEGVEVQSEVDKLIKDAGVWSNTLHGEIWVFDQGYWQKEADLWRSIAKSRWEDVILDEEEKTNVREDARRFFDGREKYDRYRIAWKRGIIYYGPPGNGKTISIKALSNELSKRSKPVSTLYVKTLTSFGGPERSVSLIFAKARAEAPCLLVLEDLDSLITDQVRSYFLNEVDGLNTNSGVYMIGSTNHMDRLDPGISNRPSRFDRKFEFPKPDEAQRVTYCEYWRHKLETNTKSKATVDNDDDNDLVHVDGDEIDFPAELSPEIARITDGFSFAYLQEAFVATLLTIAANSGDVVGAAADGTAYGGGDKKDKFAHLLFWRVIKRQIALLKEQI